MQVISVKYFSVIFYICSIQKYCCSRGGQSQWSVLHVITDTFNFTDEFPYSYSFSLLYLTDLLPLHNPVYQLRKIRDKHEVSKRSYHRLYHKCHLNGICHSISERNTLSL